MKVTREAHVPACTSSKETETETLHSATEVGNRETRRSRTSQWHSIPDKFLGARRPSCGKSSALAPDQRLRRSRVLHSSVGVTTDSHDAANYHMMELEEQTRREVAHESDATRSMTTRKSQSGEQKPTSAGESHEPKPRIDTKEGVCNASSERETVTRSQTGACMSQPGEERVSDGREEKTAKVGTQESVNKEQCHQQAKTLIRDGSEKIGVGPRGDSSCPRNTEKD